ncbi:hypothetical protein PtB15_15B432 [Puccinia triticina]|nr:hypothetical protein PtB15_15B432 [Puccinia triticina]
MSGESAKLDWSGRANLFVSPQLSPHLPPTINPSIQQLPPLQLEFPTLQSQAGPFPAATGTGLGSPSGLGPRTNHRTPDAGPNGFGPPSTGYGPRGFDTEQNSEFSSQTGGAGYDTGSVVGSENPEDVEDKPLQELPILGVEHLGSMQRGFVDKEVPNKLHLVLLQGNPSMPLARDLLQPLVLFALLQAPLCIPHQAKQRKESNNVGSVQRLSQRRSPHMDQCK